MTRLAPAGIRTLVELERNLRERAEVVDVIIHAPLWNPSRMAPNASATRMTSYSHDCLDCIDRWMVK